MNVVLRLKQYWRKLSQELCQTSHCAEILWRERFEKTSCCIWILTCRQVCCHMLCNLRNEFKVATKEKLHILHTNLSSGKVIDFTLQQHLVVGTNAKIMAEKISNSLEKNVPPTQTQNDKSIEKGVSLQAMISNKGLINISVIMQNYNTCSHTAWANILLFIW